MKRYEVKKTDVENDVTTIILIMSDSLDKVVKWCADHSDDVYHYEPVQELVI